MMKQIEKSLFRKGEYRGYAIAGKTTYAMRIRRGGKGWETYYDEATSKAFGGCYTYMTARTLAELNRRLAGGTC